MRAQLKWIMSADIEFDTYCPEDPTCFSFPIEMDIGPEGEEGAEIYQLTVCTPAWIAKEYQVKTVALGAGLLIVFEYNWPVILSAIEDLVSSFTADDWYTLSRKLSRVADWEFADYQPYKPDPPR